MAKLIHTEPFRSLYVGSKVTTVIAKVPFWILLYSIGADRPRPSWTLKKTLAVNILRELIEMPMETGDFRGRDPTKEVPSRDCNGTRFIWLDKVPSNLIVGEVKRFADACSTESVRIPAYGYGRWGAGAEIPLAHDGEKVLMHIHGGAFVMGTAHPEDLTSYIPRGFLEYGHRTFTRTISIEYRLSASNPQHTNGPFPTALLDTLAGYLYLTRTLGFKPQNVFISGDSAGGNIAQSLVRYLRDHPELGMGAPGGLILFSPWADPTGTHYGAPNSVAFENSKSDFVRPQIDPESMGQYGLRSLLGNISVQDARQNPYVAPGSLEMSPEVVQGMFSGFPPCYVVGGGGETLLDAIRTLQERMAVDIPKESFVYDEVADAIHDFVCLPLWEPERSNTLKNIVDWIQRL
ncbi:Steryl acetyl hydrolase [Rhizoctonia solani]|uniref:Steryl acetyl hydrolase n=1 Tax=Rhizoctonia solani TaxID=456999 RepID=A0A8H7IIQ3_9AGAM|nr:Steryl acetyl hydrolase [Rhizoctonia solani]